MKTTRSSCWLILWDYLRLSESRTDLAHLRLPEFVGTIPGQFDSRTVEQMLRPILLSHAPLSVGSIVECGKSFRSGQPKIERPGCCSEGRVVCTFGRMRLVAKKVRKLEVVDLDDGKERLSWIEGRTFKFEADENGNAIEDKEIEITPERERMLIIAKEQRAIL